VSAQRAEAGESSSGQQPATAKTERAPQRRNWRRSKASPGGNCRNGFDGAKESSKGHTKKECVVFRVECGKRCVRDVVGVS
jgi:hypothetical protein